MKLKSILIIALFLSGTVVSISGCGNSKCEEARVEGKKLLDSSSTLERERNDLERKLWYEYSDYCSSIVENKDLLDSSWDEIYCKDWEERGRPTSAVTLNNSEFARLTNEINNQKRRWAITVTTYKDCFEPSQVISGEEILRG